MVEYTFQDSLNSVLQLGKIVNKLNTETYFHKDAEFKKDLRTVSEKILIAYRSMLFDMARTIVGEKFTDKISNAKKHKRGLTAKQSLETIQAAVRSLDNDDLSLIGLTKRLLSGKIKKEVAVIMSYSNRKNQLVENLSLAEKEKIALILTGELYAELEN